MKRFLALLGLLLFAHSGCRDAETTTQLFAPPGGPDLSGDLVRFTFDPDPDEQPVWSPSGETVAYTLRTGLFLLDLTSGKRQALQPELLFIQSFHLSPTWSPDGTALAFIRVRPAVPPFPIEVRFLTVRELQVGGRARLLADFRCPPDCRRPSEVAWSPAGDVLAVVTVNGINLLPSSGGELALLDGTQGGVNPAWHPDGDRLAFVQGGRIRVLTIATGEVAALTEGNRLAWSPDGESLAFDRGGRLFVIPVGGGAVQPAAPIAGADPTWGPDGRRFMFVSEESGNPDLWLARLEE